VLVLVSLKRPAQNTACAVPVLGRNFRLYLHRAKGIPHWQLKRRFRGGLSWALVHYLVRDHNTVQLKAEADPLHKSGQSIYSSKYLRR